MAWAAAYALDLAVPHVDRERYPPDTDGVGGIGSGLLRGFDEMGGAIGEIGLVEDFGHAGSLRRDVWCQSDLGKHDRAICMATVRVICCARDPRAAPQ